MDAHLQPATPAEAEWVAVQRRWADGWRRVIMMAIPLVYLVFLVAAVAQNSHGAGQVVGYTVLAAFAVCWLAAPLLFSPDRPLPRFWLYYALLAALFAAELPFARAAGFVLCVFLTILTVGRSVPGPLRSSPGSPSPPSWFRSRSRPGTSASGRRSTTSRRSRYRSPPW